MARRSNWFIWYAIVVAFALSCAGLIANDKPIAVRHQGQWYFPIVKSYQETAFGGDFESAADFRDPSVQKLIVGKGGSMIWPPVRFSYDTTNVDLVRPAPSPPTWLLGEDECRRVSPDGAARGCRDIDYNWLGTDDQQRDVLARLLHGSRIALWVGLAAMLIWLVPLLGAQSLGWHNSVVALRSRLATIFAVAVILLIVVDYSGFGVPPTWPSLGEMLRQATENPQSPWLWAAAGSGVVLMVLIWLLIERAIAKTAVERTGDSGAGT